MRPALLIAIAAALILGLHPARARAQDDKLQDDKLIVPGERIGPVRLGITDVALYKLLGEPNGLNSTPGAITYLYVHRGLFVYVDSLTHKVFEIDVGQNAEFHTADGIKVGMSKTAVRTQLEVLRDNRPPEPGGILRIDYNAGMTFAFLKDGKLYKIGVWVPGGPRN